MKTVKIEKETSLEFRSSQSDDRHETDMSKIHDTPIVGCF